MLCCFYKHDLYSSFHRLLCKKRGDGRGRLHCFNVWNLIHFYSFHHLHLHIFTFTANLETNKGRGSVLNSFFSRNFPRKLDILYYINKICNFIEFLGSEPSCKYNIRFLGNGFQKFNHFFYIQKFPMQS